MYIDDYGNEYETEEEYLRTLKQNDNYHFSIPFEYIEKNYGNDNYDIAEAIMEVDVDWDDFECGYRISYSCSDMYKIDPAQGNGNEDDFYFDAVERIVLDELESIGIESRALVGGTGTF